MAIVADNNTVQGLRPKYTTGLIFSQGWMSTADPILLQYHCDFLISCYFSSSPSLLISLSLFLSLSFAFLFSSLLAWHKGGPPFHPIATRPHQICNQT